MTNEKRDIHNIGKRLISATEDIRASSMSDRQKAQIEKFMLDMRIGKGGQKVQGHRVVSYLIFLRKLQDYFKKDLDTITEAEATKFYTDLMDNKIVRKFGLPYAEATKDMFVRTLKRFLGWAFKGRENPKYIEIAKWMKDVYRKSNKQAITLEECEKVLSEESSENAIRNKCFFMFLFDSGARIEECLNVRISEDLQISKKKDGGEYYKVHLKGSKTEAADRTISIPLTTKYLNDWLSKHPTGKAGDFLFPLEYDNARKIIRQMTKKSLNIGLSPHELRHSSASHYAAILGDRTIFFHRYGWKYNSDVGIGYIHQNKLNGDIGQEEAVKVVESGRIERLEQQNEELKKKTEELQKCVKLMFNQMNKTKMKEYEIKGKEVFEV